MITSGRKCLCWEEKGSYNFQGQLQKTIYLFSKMSGMSLKFWVKGKRWLNSYNYHNKIKTDFLFRILINIVSVLPTSTVCREKDFSLMKIIKNKFRSSMENESLNDLMMINMNGPTLKDFNPSNAVDLWYFNSKTNRHVHGHCKPDQ